MFHPPPLPSPGWEWKKRGRVKHLSPGGKSLECCRPHVTMQLCHFSTFILKVSREWKDDWGGAISQLPPQGASCGGGNHFSNQHSGSDRCRAQREATPKKGERRGCGGGGSAPLLAVDGEGELDVEQVVVLHQRRVPVVQHQLLQRRVQVVRLGEAEARARLVDHAVLHFAFHPGERETHTRAHKRA